MSRALALALFLTVGVTLGIGLALTAPESDATQEIEWLDNPRAIGSFQLKTDGGSFDRQSLAGQWTIVLFGFLQCPDICPTSMSELAGLTRGLREDALTAEVVAVFVSVDPARDSVAEVGQYARLFDDSILGVTGSVDELRKLAGDLGAQFKVSGRGDDYAVAHSVTYSIIDPNGKLFGRFRPGFDQANLVENFRSGLVQQLAFHSNPQR